MFIIIYYKISRFLKVIIVKNGLKVLNKNKQVFTKSEITKMLNILEYSEIGGETNV